MRAILIALTGMGNAALTALRTAGIDVRAVITDPGTGPGFPHYPCEELLDLCNRLGLDAWTGFDFRAPDAVERIVAAAPDVVIIATSPKIVPAALVAAVGGRVINCHPSLLPRHRGPTPIPWTLECGDTETGISYIQPTAELDAGPIWSQVRVPVYPGDTAGVLRYRLDQEVVPATLPAVVVAVARGEITPALQVGPASREPRYSAAVGDIDWKTMSAAACLRRFQARTPFPGVFVDIDGEISRIHRMSHIGEAKLPAGTLTRIDAGAAAIDVADGRLLCELAAGGVSDGPPAGHSATVHPRALGCR